MNFRNETETEEFINNLKYFFENIDTELKKVECEIANKELERDDMLHEIELGNLNAVELGMAASKLRKIMQNRRVLKNQREYIYTLKGFSDKFITKGIIGDSKQLLTNIENLNRARKERKYTPRILKDLKIGKWKEKQ